MKKLAEKGMPGTTAWHVQAELSAKQTRGYTSRMSSTSWEDM